MGIKRVKRLKRVPLDSKKQPNPYVRENKNGNGEIKKQRTEQQIIPGGMEASSKEGSEKEKVVALDLGENARYLEQKLLPAADVIFKYLDILDKENSLVRFLMIYIKGVTDEEILNEYILKALWHHIPQEHGSFQKIKQMLFAYSITIKEEQKLDQILDALLEGHLALFLEGYENAFIIDMKHFQKRSIATADTETVLIGSQEAFNEDIETNIGIIRRRIRDSHLKILWESVGSQPKTTIALVYLEGVIQADIVTELQKRIKHLSHKEVVGLQELKKEVFDNPYSIFPQAVRTERPDRVADALLRGRAVIILDGNPFVLLVPAYFTDFIESMEDSNEYFYFATGIRIIRILAVFATVTLSPLYVALLSFHYELVHADLIVELARYRARVPFPPVVEAFIMEGIADLIREASARLPKQVAPTIGIVGALILGQASITAGIVSPIMILVVAVTTIVASIIPDYSFAYSIRILRYVMIVLSAVLGAYGISIGLMIILAHWCSLTSFGYAYYSPIAPTRFHDWKNTVLKLPDRSKRSRQK